MTTTDRGDGTERQWTVEFIFRLH